MENPSAPILSALKDISGKLSELTAYIKDRIAEIDLPELGDQPLEPEPVEINEHRERSAALAVAAEVAKHPRLGAAALTAMLRSEFGTAKVVDVNPAHFNHLVAKCRELIDNAEAEAVDPLAQ